MKLRIDSTSINSDASNCHIYTVILRNSTVSIEVFKFTDGLDIQFKNIKLRNNTIGVINRIIFIQCSLALILIQYMK